MCIKEWEIPNKNTPPFKVGDKVKILPRNGSQEDYYPEYADGMLKYAGRLATITLVTKTSYKIDLDDSRYYWPFEALQLVISEMDEPVNLHNLKNGDYIKIIYNELFFIYIVNRVENSAIYKHAAYYSDDGSINVNPNQRWIVGEAKITYATEEERKLLDNALLKEGYRWNNSTKQLESIGVIDLHTEDITVSSFYNSLRRVDNMFTDILSYKQKEPQTETELNLFPTKKHYQLNFNY